MAIAISSLLAMVDLKHVFEYNYDIILIDLINRIA